MGLLVEFDGLSNRLVPHEEASRFSLVAPNLASFLRSLGGLLRLVLFLRKLLRLLRLLRLILFFGGLLFFQVLCALGSGSLERGELGGAPRLFRGLEIVFATSNRWVAIPRIARGIIHIGRGKLIFFG